MKSTRGAHFNLTQEFVEQLFTNVKSTYVAIEGESRMAGLLIKLGDLPLPIQLRMMYETSFDIFQQCTIALCKHQPYRDMKVDDLGQEYDFLKEHLDKIRSGPSD